MNSGLSPLESVYAQKTVWLSGHTGFKGSWLAHWLLALGAKVHGFALQPATKPSLFEQLGLADRLTHEVGDLKDSHAVRQSIQKTRPDFVFHLGAQAIVRTSFENPVDTYATNVMGTIHVLEALRALEKSCAAVLITSDKCYENREWLHGYREVDPLGGHDPYSSAKAAAEIAIASWRRSFFSDHPVRIASARAGNVIGGGDWGTDRILPDSIRALQHGMPIPVRNKLSTRPWQHVLEPLSGYLWLAAVMSRPSLRPYEPGIFTSAFNFGPNLESNRTVAQLVTEVLKHWPGRWEDRTDPKAAHEARLLNLAIEKALHVLGWRPVWNFEKAVAATVAWYRGAATSTPGQIMEMTSQQIEDYRSDAAGAGLPWETDRNG